MMRVADSSSHVWLFLVKKKLNNTLTMSKRGTIQQYSIPINIKAPSQCMWLIGISLK